VKREDVIRVRDSIYNGLLVREGQTITAGTSGIAWERANNIATGLMGDIDDMINAALVEAARGVVVTGTIQRNPGDIDDKGERP
jgi:hypothetical protein